jgi:gliding motility-associated-like protein
LEETDFACAHIGINYVSVFAIDENGNIGTISIELEILDTIPPIITYCPADIVSCDSIIDYDTPTALDNCSNLNSLLTAGVESGVRFDIGLTEIQFSFSDTSGNSTTCDFSVKRISSPEITVSRDTTIFNGSAIGLTVQVDSAVDSYYWTPEDYLDDPSSNNPDASPIETTTYRVVVTTNDGCEMEDSVNIIVLNEVVVYNAFSPNNDGQNDYLEINGLDYYPDANVLIVNRAGAKVFESGGYSEPWDGRYKGEEMPVGPYFYFIDTGVSGAEILTGDISLIR